MLMAISIGDGIDDVCISSVSSEDIVDKDVGAACPSELTDDESIQFAMV